MNLQNYIDAGYEVARLNDLSDLTPGRVFMNEPFGESGNVAIRKDDCFVLRVTPFDSDEEAAIEAMLGETATVVGASFKQFVFRLPLLTITEGLVGGIGLLHRAEIRSEVLAPPSRLWSRTTCTDTLSWKDETNLVPARIPDALISELVTAARLPYNARELIEGAE